MSERIVFADGTVFQCPEQPKAPIQPYRDRKREWKKLTVCADLALAKEKFVDGIVYFREWDGLTLDDQGKENLETFREELSAYSIAGDLVDTRDGNIMVYMGKPTEMEQAEKVIAVAEDLVAVADDIASGGAGVDALSAAVAAFRAKKEKIKPEPPKTHQGPAPKPKNNKKNKPEKEPKP